MSDHVLGEGRYLRLLARNSWEFIQRKGISGIVLLVAVTDDRRLVLVEEFRQAVQGAVIGLPAGLVGDEEARAGETLADAARRELLEETGYAAATLRRILRVPTSPASSSDYYEFFRAGGLCKAGPGGGVAAERESIITHEVPLAELPDWLRQQAAAGKLIDPKVFTAAWLAERPDYEIP